MRSEEESETNARMLSSFTIGVPAQFHAEPTPRYIRFGSSDGTDTAEVLFTNGRGHRRRGSTGSSLALSKETYSVATKEGNHSGAPRPTHGRSGSKAYAGETGKLANPRVGGNRGSSGSSA